MLELILDSHYAQILITHWHYKPSDPPGLSDVYYPLSKNEWHWTNEIKWYDRDIEWNSDRCCVHCPECSVVPSFRDERIHMGLLYTNQKSDEDGVGYSIVVNDQRRCLRGLVIVVDNDISVIMVDQTEKGFKEITESKVLLSYTKRVNEYNLLIYQQKPIPAFLSLYTYILIKDILNQDDMNYWKYQSIKVPDSVEYL